mmetsp:Transcript_18384/g.39803  ORF Transcript_18384/g.39803 Transcript_18384/m.39803 type:complete len:446 (-) Transcript_18384:352-1689(-)
MRAASLIAASLLLLSQHILVSAQDIQLVAVIQELSKATGFVSPRDGSRRMFAFEQCGTIRTYKRGKLYPEPFMEIDDVRCKGNEEGLLGLAFSPNFREDGYFYVNLSNGNGRSYRDGDIKTLVRRYSVSADNKMRGDPSSFETILEFSQPFGNHNGGDLAFGPDGFLYVATGDGGSGGDPQNNSQNKANLLGKILRLDVNNRANKYIPPDNPFVNDKDAKSEIWSYGVRNPWRMSFDMENGDLFFGDVGQNKFEEVNHQPAGVGGQNYGWRVMEARSCFDSDSDIGCSDPSLTEPILAYGTNVDGCSVIGGYRYRGKQMPDLIGKYIYGDYCSGTIWYATQNPDDNAWSSEILVETGMRISSFGESESGELYVVDHDGTIYKVAVASTSCTDRQEFAFFGNPNKTCSWLLQRGKKRKRRKLCRRTESDGAKARNICPMACKSRCQ